MQDFERHLHQYGYRLNTIRGIIGGTRLYLTWCNQNSINNQEATYSDVLNYLEHVQERIKNKRTLSSKIQAIRVYYNYLIRQSIRDTNPLIDLRIKNNIRQLPHNILPYDKLQTLYTHLNGEGIAGKRDRIIIGLAIWQALTTGEITALEVSDIKIHEGKIYVPQTGRTNSRVLKLEAHQVIEMQNYIRQTRPLLLAMHNKKTEKLFVSLGKGAQMSNTYYSIMKKVRKINPNIKTAKHIRASVISHWLKHFPIRQVQYMIGHRYVSSTERYSTKKLDSLQEQLEKLMPEI